MFLGIFVILNEFFFFIIRENYIYIRRRIIGLGERYINLKKKWKLIFTDKTVHGNGSTFFRIIKKMNQG